MNTPFANTNTPTNDTYRKCCNKTQLIYRVALFQLRSQFSCSFEWKSAVEKLCWPRSRIPHCVFTEEGNVRLKTGAASDTVVFRVPSVAASWCHCAITQRRAACWLGSYAAPIWQPWTPTATLTPSSKCKSSRKFMNKPGMLQIMQLPCISNSHSTAMSCHCRKLLDVVHSTVNSQGIGGLNNGYKIKTVIFTLIISNACLWVWPKVNTDSSFLVRPCEMNGWQVQSKHDQ